MSFRSHIRPFVDSELVQARHMRLAQDYDAEFRHLERAHILGQASTIEHVRVHALMFAWALRQRKASEGLGQILRIIGAATKTALGLVPMGNTGGSNVSPFKPMPIPTDLQRILDMAR
ncbi:MAG: DUF3703 domain-containing protein [Sinobacteraceae bacterium]|jgi:hypothetical protein|nr:DUF3703 domain-containing protein [Nevskiaceae bacterium]